MKNNIIKYQILEKIYGNMVPNISQNKSMILGITLGTITMFSIIFLIIFFAIRHKILKGKKDTAGFIFEKRINGKTAIFAKSNGYKYFNGGTFKHGIDHFFEIDGFLVTNKSAFVIETKKYDGELYGDFNAPNLYLRNGKKEIKINNPIAQNLKHIKHIYKMCDFIFPIFSVIILPTDTTWNIENEDSWSIMVTEANFENKINEVLAEIEDIIPEREIMALSEIIENSRVSSYKEIKKFGKLINSNKNK